MAFSLIGCVKLGHPVPDSNFIEESKSGVLQQTQLYKPASWAEHKAPECGASVPLLRVKFHQSLHISNYTISAI